MFLRYECVNSRVLFLLPLTVLLGQPHINYSKRRKGFLVCRKVSNKFSHQKIELSFSAMVFQLKSHKISVISFLVFFFFLFAPGILELQEPEDIAQAEHLGARWPLVLTGTGEKHRGLWVACGICIMVF